MGVSVGLLTVQLLLPGCNSLKEKRQVLRSVIDRLHNRYQVSAAEVGENDIWRRATLGVAMVSNSRSHLDSVLTSVMKEISARYDAEVLDSSVEWL